MLVAHRIYISEHRYRDYICVVRPAVPRTLPQYVRHDEWSNRVSAGKRELEEYTDTAIYLASAPRVECVFDRGQMSGYQLFFLTPSILLTLTHSTYNCFRRIVRRL